MSENSRPSTFRPARSLLLHGVARPLRKLSSIAKQASEALYDAVKSMDRQYNRFFHDSFDAGPTQVAVDGDTAEQALIGRYWASLKPRFDALPYQPLVSVLVPVYKVPAALLRETLASVAGQIYDRWELCIVDDASGMPEIDAVIRTFADLHPGRVKYAINDKNGHISVTSNRCLELAAGDYVALLDHDDVLLPHALGEMARYINHRDRPEILYSDERLVDKDGERFHGPFYKPDWSPFFHLSVNYTTHLSVYKTELLRKIGGFRQGFEGAQDHDLMLRAVEGSTKPVVHVPFILYQWRALEGSTASSIDEKPYAVVNGVKAVKEACERRYRPAEVEWERETFHYKIKFELPEHEPLVSIIIPSKDRPELIGTCLDSIFRLSTYKNVEILLVDNGSTDPAAFATYQKFQAAEPGRITVIAHDAPFNFGAMNNVAARQAKGEYLVLLNNDTEVVTARWLEELLSYAQFPDVGAVGCKLLYPDLTIQHAGLALVDRRIAAHSLKYLPHNTSHYLDSANTLREVAAVTAACLMVKRADYLAVGGLDEVDLPNGFGDVDFCLKLARLGRRQVYTPHATLIHYESPSRGASIENYEKMVMLERWSHELLNDPYMNFHLLRHEHVSPAIEAHIDPKRETLRDYWRSVGLGPYIAGRAVTPPSER